MKVYGAELCYPYEGSHVVGMYASLEGAKAGVVENAREEEFVLLSWQCIDHGDGSAPMHRIEIEDDVQWYDITVYEVQP